MKIEIGSINDVLAIDTQMPEFDGRNTQQKLTQRLSDLPHLILIAKVDGALAGYKLGYQLNEREFYSWLGGVLPQYRQQGIATALRLYQEAWAKQSGYTSIQVKSMNRYPNMLRLLISSGYQIIGDEQDESQSDGKILFHKELD
ncbi:GNAT family N-acetyltransferase [Vibrio gangliei]|uniref:GNAT family N-acetyltransferase n=1 Tax=Vibrio gangliei TaxID=2077090 RepID=UPI000D01F7E7|nr:GNAT family N-acetyltransferase [Vibrio gangliei]